MPLQQRYSTFIIAGREPIAYSGINIVGLRRRGFSNELIENIHNAYRIIYNSGKNVTEALEQVKQEIPTSQRLNTSFLSLRTHSEELSDKK